MGIARISNRAPRMTQRIARSGALCAGIAAVRSLGIGMTNPAAAADAGATDDSRISLAEIVVTAEKRAEKLQDVPIAITAFNQAILEAVGVRNMDDLRYITPGLNINSQLSRLFSRDGRRQGWERASAFHRALLQENVMCGPIAGFSLSTPMSEADVDQAPEGSVRALRRLSGFAD